jgi:hypothetical protein
MLLVVVSIALGSNELFVVGNVILAVAGIAVYVKHRIG